MTHHISGSAPFPDDFSAELGASPFMQQIHGFLSTQADSLSSLKISFENKFGHSPPLVKEGFQVVLHSMVDDATTTVRSFLDTHASEHTMLPNEIDHFLEKTSSFLKDNATIDMRPSFDPNVYRGSQLLEGTQAKEGVSQPHLGFSSAHSPLGGTSQGSSENSSQFMQELEELYGPKKQAPPPAPSLSPSDIAMLSLCADFFVAKNPQDKMTIFNELQQVLQGNSPPKDIWSQAYIEEKEAANPENISGDISPILGPDDANPGG